MTEEGVAEGLLLLKGVGVGEMKESAESEKEKATREGKGTKSGKLALTEAFWQKIKDIVKQTAGKENLSCGLFLENVAPEGKRKKEGKVTEDWYQNLWEDLKKGKEPEAKPEGELAVAVLEVIGYITICPKLYIEPEERTSNMPDLHAIEPKERGRT